MKYMGSKRAMLENGLGNLLVAESKHKLRIVDLFSGSGSVSWFAAQNLGKQVIATDLQLYAVILARAVIGRTQPLSVANVKSNWFLRAENWLARKSSWSEAVRLDESGINTKTWSKRAKELCGELRPHNAPIWKAYGGHYFCPSQAMIFDALLATLPTSDPQRTACHASLIIAGSKCVASPGHTAQPFKATNTAYQHLKEAWLRDPYFYVETAMNLIFGAHSKKIGVAKKVSANVFAKSLRKTDLVFVDPPYSGVQYSRFYHVLETIANKKCGDVTGVGRYPPRIERPQSNYSLVTNAANDFSDLMKTLAENSCTSIVTFPSGECSNGITGEEVEVICKRFFTVSRKIVKTRFSTLGGNNSGRPAWRLTDELIFLLKPR